jgi:hypothetical protein
MMFVERAARYTNINKGIAVVLDIVKRGVSC